MKAFHERPESAATEPFATDSTKVGYPPNSGCLPAIRDDEVTELGFMLGNFTKIAAGNPYLIAQTAWENLPPSQKTSLT